jgi:hypothetical protein
MQGRAESDLVHDTKDRMGGRDGAVHALHPFHRYKHAVFTLPVRHKLGPGLT